MDEFINAVAQFEKKHEGEVSLADYLESYSLMEENDRTQEESPLVAKKIGLTTPRESMIFGGLMGTTSGTTAGLAATDASLVPYGAMTSTFYTGLGCLLCPSVLYPLTKLILG